MLGSFTRAQFDTAMSDANLGWVKVIDWTGVDFTTAIAIDFSPYISARRLRIEFSGGLVSTDGTELFVRTSTNDGVSFDSGAGDYSWAFRGYSTSPATLDSSNGSDTTIQLTSVGAAEGIDSASTGTFTGSIIIDNPSNATVYKLLTFNFGYVREGGTGLVTIQGHGLRQAAADIDGIQIYPTAGNISLGYAVFAEF